MSAEIKDLLDSVEAKHKEIETVLVKSGTDSKAAIETAEKAVAEIKSLADRVLDIEQKTAEAVKRGVEAPKTLGKMLIETDSFKQFAAGITNKARVELKNTITGQAGSPAENSDILVPSQRLAGIIPGAFRTLRVRDVLVQGTTSSNLVEYTRELAFTNRAAETAEGAQKPETDVTFELASAPVRTIAHFLKLSKQVMDDAPALASYIDTRLRYGVELKIDQQLLNGNGSGQNISGMTDSGNFTPFTPESGDNAIDSINRAIYEVIGADYAPTAIMMNPKDWGQIERTKINDSYVFGSPGLAVGPVLWGLPVVVTNSMTEGKFMVGAMDVAYQVWNRQGTIVEMSESDDTNFQRNLVTVRAESRLALAVYRPASVVYGDLVV
jgi:HK97 family phage major capsid protein